MILVLSVLTPYHLYVQKENNKEKGWGGGKSSVNVPLAIYG